LQFTSLLWLFKRLLSDRITEWNQWEKVISSLDSYFCWSPPVVLGHKVCSICLFTSLLWLFKRLLSCCLVSPMYWRSQIAHSRR
jgi:hypothetical protein